MANRWVLGARPRTLPAAVVPVVVGTAVARSQGPVIWWRAGAALVVAVAIQVATNYVNDYADGVRGTDDVRVGPVRLVGGGLATAAAVRNAALVSATVAGVAGLALAAAVGWQLIPVGIVCLAAGYFYTGGPKPYGYAGLGEVFVFVFFGLVACAGTAYVILEQVTGLAILASVPVGLLAVALLLVNNLRDIPTDTVSGKRTLAVRIGDPGTRTAYIGCVVLPFAVGASAALARPFALTCLLAAPFAVAPIRAVIGGARGRDLIPVLQGTARLQLAFGLAFAAGLALS